MTDRVYLVGTDTGVGKTALACALLRQARARGLAAVPFKPAQSGPPPTDAERLVAAAGLAVDQLARVCPLSYAQPIAPGLAADASAFVAGGPPDPAPLARAADALAALERDHAATIAFVEGAGGVHVPMPGATWQSAWIARLASASVVVGRAALGTINHCLLAIDALRALGCPPLGFYLCETEVPAPGHADDAAVIVRARALPHLGTLPRLARPDEAPAVDLLSPLLAALRD